MTEHVYIMKRILTFLSLSALLLTMGCGKNFLDLKPQQSVFAEDVFSSLATARAAVNGLYSLMQSYSYYGRDALVIPEVLSDNATRSVRTGNRYAGMNTMTHTATDANVSRMWNQMYKVVSSANNIIANEEKLRALITPLQQEEFGQLIGEAYAVRALAYFDLAKFFARPLNHTVDGSHLGVPLVLKAVTKVTEVVYPARNSVKEVYEQIEKDLSEALKRLPTTGNVWWNGSVNPSFSKIRMNRWGTLALRARVAIFKGDWQSAVSAATEVISSGRFSLLPYGSLVQDFRTPNNNESIFEVTNNTNDNPGTDGIAYLCSQEGYGEMLGTQTRMNSRSTGTTLTTFRSLYESYRDTDMRRQFVALGNRNSIGGETNVPLCLKYTNIVTFLENIKVFRLSEMYLSRGEALARLAVQNNDNNALTASLADINFVRMRRDTASTTKPFAASLLAMPPAGSIRAAAYVDSIIVERRKEFALEGQRLFDLNRTKTNYVKINSAGNSTSRLIDYQATTNSYYYRTILPIPVSQVQNNPKMVQNPGF
ncbi:MAG: RagB/SusD family nutrient uptake outer membrane protein [Bacteroidetes bacterium]|nr:RagB/SusD family nutrient uptake outer membrane protein [Bacteroidota bacterium]